MGHQANTAVAIIGAGPYGLSLAAHLRSEGVELRIFGMPMHCWRAHMPKGMFLKSEGCASNLFDPAGAYSLRQYCAERGLPYAPYGTPVPLETLTQYGLSFQQRFVPTVENVMVTTLGRLSDIFELRLANEEMVRAGKVVVATGMSHAAHIPTALAQLPAELLSHSSVHHDLSGFKGRDVTVIGGGQSALETAALLHEAGAEVRLLVRRHSILWNEAPILNRRSLFQRMRHPMSHLGPGLGPWFYANAPMLFCYLPQKTRIARTQKALGPAGAWWLRERVVGRLPILLGHSVRGAETCGQGVLLHLQRPDGELRRLTTDHVIAATGYRFALGSLPFLSKRLRSQLHSIRQTPVLSPNFESSVRGLYFTGLASANQFGPAMRFLHGADFTARRASRHIAAGGHRFGVPLFAGPSRMTKCESV
jgi:cation diffusion facilitator CzcD-associated flavoprotein CzcO